MIGNLQVREASSRKILTLTQSTRHDRPSLLSYTRRLAQPFPGLPPDAPRAPRTSPFAFAAMPNTDTNKTETTLSSAQVRQQFIDFFVERHGHTYTPSSPVVPHDDQTLLFANAGMNQFKPYFLGTEQPPTPPRAANTQKCIRAGGKHNDLDDVGKDTYHHTFFEMLGNWSFGDYFKAEAIDWAWELLVDQWGLDPSKLYATYFEGDPSEGLEPDDEARELWLKKLPEDHVLPGNKKDNFWEMGDTGPCGPCSEIHYDGRLPEAIAATPGRGLVNQDDPDVIEIWNLVFIQFNRNADSSLVSLPAKHVDTGMGFERIVRVLQGKDSNYDSDAFAPIFAEIQKVTGAREYLPGGSGENLTDPINVAYRVIADHVRCLVFALSDGAHCGNKGRDAVLRTILRRAVRFGHQNLGVEEPFVHKLVPFIVSLMSDAFPEITKNPEAVADELHEEEVSFRKTLVKGIGHFNNAAYECLRNYPWLNSFNELFELTHVFSKSLYKPLEHFHDEDTPQKVESGIFPYPEEFKLFYANTNTINEISLGLTYPLHHAQAELPHMGDCMPVSRNTLKSCVLMQSKHKEACLKSLSNIEKQFINSINALRESLSNLPHDAISYVVDLSDSFLTNLSQHISNVYNEINHPYTLDGDTVFDLEATYGFPASLTQAMADEFNLIVDIAGYDKAKQKHAEISRAGGGLGDCKGSLVEIIQQRDDLTATTFVGYDVTELSSIESRIVVLKRDGESFIEAAAQAGEEVAIVIDQTPFYATAGGQVADTGAIQIGSDARIDISDVTKVGDIYFHQGTVVSGSVSSADSVTLSLAVDRARRDLIMANHTTTHVMNRALRDHVNSEADQRGSLVDDEKLRFDFSNPKGVEEAQIALVEQQVNGDIDADLTVHTGIVPQEEALQINGLRAVFGEKYPPKVRVVSIGAAVNDLTSNPSHEAWKDLSIEFCGGTHLPSTGLAKRFVIVSEEAVSKGIRRITALTGHKAEQAIFEGQELLEQANALENAPAESLSKQLEELTQSMKQATLGYLDRRALQSKLAALQDKLKQLKKAQGSKLQQLAIEQVQALAESLPAGDSPIVVQLEGVDANALRSAMDTFTKLRPDSPILLSSVFEEKVALNAAVPKAWIAKGLKAGNWIKATAKIVGGGGGGKPDSAQAGGKDPSKLDEALETARTIASET